jgi:hypothetical protein
MTVVVIFLTTLFGLATPTLRVVQYVTVSDNVGMKPQSIEMMHDVAPVYWPECVLQRFVDYGLVWKKRTPRHQEIMCLSDASGFGKKRISKITAFSYRGGFSFCVVAVPSSSQFLSQQPLFISSSYCVQFIPHSCPPCYPKRLSYFSLWPPIWTCPELAFVTESMR